MTIDDALVEQLRLLPDGAKPDMAKIRVAVGCSAIELRAAVQTLRYQGKLAWDRIALSASMRPAKPPVEPNAPRNSRGAGCVAAKSAPAPAHTAAGAGAGDGQKRISRLDLKNAPSGMDLMVASWRAKRGE